MGGHDPYSNSKGCAELVSSGLPRVRSCKGAGIALATARAGNVIGGGDWAADRLVPDILRALRAAASRCMIRNPHAIRPWQHVLEPLSGYLLLAERLFERRPGRRRGLELRPARRGCAARAVDRRAPVRRTGATAPAGRCNAATHPHEANFLKLDISKARQRLRLAPALALETALDAHHRLAPGLAGRPGHARLLPATRSHSTQHDA